MIRGILQTESHSTSGGSNGLLQQWLSCELSVSTAVALTVNGEIRPTSRAIYTPAAAEQYGNVTSTAIITVPRGCCFNLALRSVPASEDPTVTPAPLISLQNANITINRIA